MDARRWKTVSKSQQIGAIAVEITRAQVWEQVGDPVS